MPKISSDEMAGAPRQDGNAEIAHNEQTLTTNPDAGRAGAPGDAIQALGLVLAVVHGNPFVFWHCGFFRSAV
jgi:hypothetical protein